MSSLGKSLICIGLVSSQNLTSSEQVKWNECCKNLNGLSSYCKYWQTPSVCLYGDQPCGLGADSSTCFPNASSQGYVAECDDYCERLSIPGDNSTICAYWEDQPVCAGTNVSCEVTTCNLGVQLADRCDQFCSTISKPSSQCSSLTAEAACEGTSIGCETSLCTAPITLCDNYCFRLNGPRSYCQLGNTSADAKCSIGNQSCTFRDCGGLSFVR